MCVYDGKDVSNISQDDLHIERLSDFNSQLPPEARSKQPRSRRPQAGSEPIPGRLQESFREGEASQ